jgi:molecular chaperone GrpE
MSEREGQTANNAW